jgi:hypothetical protein
MLVSGSRQNIARRLQRLYHSGFLDRPRAQLPLRFTGDLSEFVYSPTRKAKILTAKITGITISGKECKQTTSQFLSHALSVSDALVSIETTCRKNGIRFVTEEDIFDWLSKDEKLHRIQWRIAIKSGTAMEKLGVIPDSVFAIEQENADGIRRLFFFLEADRGTMPIHRKNLRLSSIRRKALAYSQTRKGKILKERFGIPGFQVVFITRSKERLERIKAECQASANDRAASLFLYATEDDLRRNPLAILRVV